MKVLILLLTLVFVGCADYNVREKSICTQNKVGFECWRMGFGSEIISLCETKEECNRICDEYRRGK